MVVTTPTKESKARRNGKRTKRKTANIAIKPVALIKWIVKKLLHITKLLTSSLKEISHACLESMHYQIKQNHAEVSSVSFYLIVALPAVIFWLAFLMLNSAEIGLWYALLVLGYKITISQIDYAAYTNTFQNNGKRVAPPANPHQPWRLMLYFALLIAALAYIIHIVYPKIFTFSAFCIFEGSLAILLCSIQDLINGLACLFEAQYPQYQPVKHMEGESTCKRY